MQPTLLIADSDPDVLAALALQAQQLGLRYLTASQPDQVLLLARAHQPDAIVLDLSPQLEGRDLLAALKRTPSTAHIPVVVLSRHEDQYTRHVCFGLGAVDYSLKPFDHLFLRRVARKTVGVVAHPG